jgi:hypothetical protein
MLVNPTIGSAQLRLQPPSPEETSISQFEQLLEYYATQVRHASTQADAQYYGDLLKTLVAMAQNGTSNPNPGQESLSLGATLLKSLSSTGGGMTVGPGISGTPTVPVKNYKPGKGKAAKAEGGVVQDVKARRPFLTSLIVS